MMPTVPVRRDEMGPVEPLVPHDRRSTMGSSGRLMRTGTLRR
jgi:hypothetical protein